MTAKKEKTEEELQKEKEKALAIEHGEYVIDPEELIKRTPPPTPHPQR